MVRNKRYIVLLVLFFLLFSSVVYSEGNNIPESKVRLYSSNICSTCKKALNSIDKAKLNKIKIYDISDDKKAEELEILSKKNDIKPTIPSLVIGDIVITDTNDIKYKIENIDEEDIERIPDIVVSHPSNIKGINIGIVLLAGLVDGVNPCAISMLLFLFSVLLSMENKKILEIGLSYAAGIFAIYFLIGLGLYKILDIFSNINEFRIIIYLLSLLILVYFLYKETKDYISIKKGKMHEVNNELSKKRKDKIHEVINKAAKGNKGIISMFLLGVAVGLLEFSCTGQVYLPTISYMSQYNPSKGLFLLIIYNLLFIMPIVIITYVVYKSKDILDASMIMYENRDKITLATMTIYILMIIYFVTMIYRSF